MSRDENENDEAGDDPAEAPPTVSTISWKLFDTSQLRAVGGDRSGATSIPVTEPKGPARMFSDVPAASVVVNGFNRGGSHAYPLTVSIANSSVTPRDAKPVEPEEAAGPSASELAEINDVAQAIYADPEMVREFFTTAAEAGPALPTDAEELEDACAEQLPPGFEMRDGWVCLVKETEKKPTEYIPVCGPFIVTCTMSSPNGEGHAREILFAADDRLLSRKTILDRELVQGSGFAKSLVDKGFRCQRGQVGTLGALLQSVRAETHKTALTNTGWHFGDVPAFVLPSGEIIGKNPTSVTAHYAGNTFKTSYRPNAASWRDAVTPFVRHNRLLTIATALPLAGPLLRLIDTDGFILHLDGPSSVGKSSAARLANSVFSKEGLRSADATANGWEPLMASHNDCALVLDELQQRKGMAKDAYAGANGSGKLRANAKGGAVEQHRWSVVQLTTGEITPAEVSIEPVNTGQLIRHVSVSVLGHKYRAFDSIGSFPLDIAFVDAIKPAASQYPGSFGPAFIEALCQDLPAAGARAKELVTAEHDHLIAMAAGRWDSSAHRRMLRHFSIIYAAGVLAIAFGLAPWTHDDLTAAVEHFALRALRQFDNPAFFSLMKKDGAIETLWMHLEKARGHFITPQNKDNPPSDAIGWKDANYAFIKRDVFDGWFGSPTEASAILKRLAGCGLISRGDGRHMLRKLPRWTGETGRGVRLELPKVPL